MNAAKRKMKMSRLLLLMLIVCSSCLSSAPVAKSEDASAKTRILFLTQSTIFTHQPVKRAAGQLSSAEIVMTQFAQQHQYEIVCSQDAQADFTPENLETFDIVMFYTQGWIPVSDEASHYFVNDWLRQKGHGFIAIHSASDSFHDPQNVEKNEQGRWYWEMLGGSFNGHPWSSREVVTLVGHDVDNPLSAPFGKEYTLTEEIYQYHNWQPENVRVLLSLDMSKTSLKKPYHVPVSWCRLYGEGKIYYNNLGHNDTTWAKPEFLASISNAVDWITGKIEVNTTPNPEVSANQEKLSEEAASR